MERKRISVRATKIMSCNGTKIVRYCFMVAALIVMCSCASNKAQAPQPETAQIEVGFDGLYFNSIYVMEKFEVGTSGHYVTYDDADAGMYDEVIRLTPRSYKKVCEAIANHEEITGRLKAVCPYETVEYELEVEEMQPIAVAYCGLQMK